MIRRLAPWAGPLVALGLLLFLYRSVLLADGQFGFRDAAHYYYPLYHKVQAEWAAGRVPLWDPSENAGMPLLGNPTAAVLYPGKLVFALASYPWAVRLYAVGHSALALAGVWALLRGWRASATAATLAGLAYAGGGPILFQYSNIIFLVGAAWLPWGLWAADGWLRRGRPGALPALAVILAMQVLGGEPQSAYFVGLCAGAYALLLARGDRPGWSGARWALVLGAGLAAWFGLALLAAYVAPGFRPAPGETAWGPFRRWLATGRLPRFSPGRSEGPVAEVAGSGLVPGLVALAWGAIGLAWVARWRRLGTGRAPLVPGLAGLAGAAALAGMLAAAQVLPVAEFTAISDRATGEGPHDVYPFSLEPHRLLELAWPGCFGRTFGTSVAWAGDILPNTTHRPWVPTLYLGGMTVLLALAGLGLGGRRGPGDPSGGSPQRAWLAGIALVAVLGSFGEYASPIWLARYVPAVAELIGPHDGPKPNAVRLDGFVRDGDGSPYHLLTLALPGFRSFRYPSKLFTLACLAISALAGLGWDRAVAAATARRATTRVALAGATTGLVGGLVVFALRGRLAAWFGARKIVTLFGPLDPHGAATDLALAAGQGALACLATAALVAWAGRRPATAGVLAALVLAVDLGSANESLVRAIPQADFEATPRVLAAIQAAERADPAPGPYRIHRMPIWNPPSWSGGGSPDRIRDFTRWELGTIQPKYGLLHGVEYTDTKGVAELYDYAWFFSPFPRQATPEAAQYLRISPGDRVVYYPRRGYDLWGSRYFILPYIPRWDDADRGVAAFLPGTTRVDPPVDAFRGAGSEAAQRRWAEQEDYQIVRNRDAFPRAWVVHDARFKPTVVGLGRQARKETMEEILFADDLFWRDPARTVFDPRRQAWVELADPGALAGMLSHAATTPREVVDVVEQAPDRVVLDANLESPGLVILADVFYPGWTLTIDDRPAPIIRANRLMRGAAVAAGRHRLVYIYRPNSFRIGATISLAGLVVLAGTSLRAWRRRRTDRDHGEAG